MPKTTTPTAAQLTAARDLHTAFSDAYRMFDNEEIDWPTLIKQLVAALLPIILAFFFNTADLAD